jgi:hypothetical protein
MNKNNQKSHDAARLTLDQFIAIYGLELETGKTVGDAFHASLREVEIIGNGVSASAVGFGRTLDEAEAALVSAMDGKKLRIASSTMRLAHTFYFKPYVEDVKPQIETARSSADKFVQLITKLNQFAYVESVELVVYNDGSSVGNCYVNFKTHSGEHLNLHLVSSISNRVVIHPSEITATINSQVFRKLPLVDGYSPQARLINVLATQRPITIHISRFDYISGKLKTAGIEFRSNVKD